MSLSENGNPKAATQPVIEIRQLTRRFGSTLAVDSVSFKVQPGEVFGFIGPNGAGKTTTMRILSTLDTPDDGEAWVDGFSVIDDPDRVRRRLGFMPDGFGTYPNVTCEEYLDFFARSYGLKGRERRESLQKVMSFTQLDRLAQKPVDGLSKGMKQRLCLGRAMVHDPSVLILDEPAAGLDPRARIELREMIVRLADEGKALLISSHILTELAEMCDRVAIIEMGRLLAVGTVDEILHGDESATLDSEQIATAGASGPRRQVLIVANFISDVSEAEKFLVERFEIQARRLNDHSLEFAFHNEPSGQADLLAAMIQSGIRVNGFRVKEKSLEEAFLHVTKGLVQ